MWIDSGRGKDIAFKRIALLDSFLYFHFPFFHFFFYSNFKGHSTRHFHSAETVPLRRAGGSGRGVGGSAH